jgi:uncharacterized membrane protein (DUF2068 family)
VDWSTRGCGRHGHTTFAPDEPELRAQLVASLASGEAWQCLRCGTFVAGPPDAHGPAARAPVVLRGKEIRSRLILRVFAVERILRAIIFGAASYFLWRYRASQVSIDQAFNRELPVLRGLFRQLGYNIDKSRLFGLLRHALTLSSHAIVLLAIGATVYALIELVEGVGLWLARRWGEYFAMVATSLGLPLEIYDLSRKVTATALVLLVVNLALVLYLAITKRLFGIRGGRRAYDEKLREESVLDAAAEAAELQAAPDESAHRQAAPHESGPRQAAPHEELAPVAVEARPSSAIGPPADANPAGLTAGEPARAGQPGERDSRPGPL